MAGACSRIHVVRPGGHRLLRRGPGPRPSRGVLVAGEEPGHGGAAGAAALGLARDRSEPEAVRRGPGRAGSPTRACLLRPERGRAGRVRLRPHLLRTQVGQPAAPAGPAGDRRRAGAAHRAAVDDALGLPGAGQAVGVRRVRSGEVIRLPCHRRWPPVSSSTGPAAPWIPTSTPTWWRPTWPRGWTGAGRRWTAGGCIAHLPAAQAVYHARLRLELGERLGGACEVARSGLGDVVGVDRVAPAALLAAGRGHGRVPANRAGRHVGTGRSSAGSPAPRRPARTRTARAPSRPAGRVAPTGRRPSGSISAT